MVVNVISVLSYINISMRSCVVLIPLVLERLCIIISPLLRGHVCLKKP